METTEIFGKTAALIVALSIVPYSIRLWQRKISTRLISWSLWALIGFSLLVTYKSSGAEDNIWPTITGFANPLLVAIIIVWKNDKYVGLTKLGKIRQITKSIFTVLTNPKKWTLKELIPTERVCLIIGLVSLTVWLFIHNDKSLAQIALYIAIIADGCALLPIITYLIKHPGEDRPFAWFVFAAGYGLALFSIKDHTYANYALPVWMVLGSSSVTAILVIYRLRYRIHLREWI